jgi:hypothetical protein
MNGHAFDHAMRYLTTELTRRSLSQTALHAALVLGGAGLPVGVAAKKKRKNKKRKKIKRNAFGCVNVGNFCQNSGHCCSGICQGKKGKKKCKAHDSGDCQAGQREEACGGEDVFCTSSAGGLGVCDTTTGNAAYCAVSAGCFACAKDADCRGVCGPAAACIVCAGECDDTGGTACVGPSECPGLPD